MKTYGLEQVLRKKLAYVPGCVSNIGRLVLVVSLEPTLSFKPPPPPPPIQEQPTKTSSGDTLSIPFGDFTDNNVETDDLAITLKFYAQLFRLNDILEFNVIVLIDNRCGNWKRLRTALKMVKTYLPQVAVALVVKAEQASTPLNVKLWLNRTRQAVSTRRGSLGNLCGADTASLNEHSSLTLPNQQLNSSAMLATSSTSIRPSTVLVICQSKLETYIAKNQLPPEFGGHYDLYNHSSWLISRIAAERYLERIESVISQRFGGSDTKTKDPTPHVAPDWRVRHLLEEKCEDPEDAMRLIELGKRVLSNLSRTPAIAKLNGDLTASVQMAITSLEPMTLLQTRKKVPGKSTDPSKVKIMEGDIPISRQEIECEIQAIRRWLANDGDRLIMCETAVGCNLRSAERLVDKHELIELDCAETFARYARLVSAFDLLVFSQQRIADDLNLQRQELDSALRTFAMRIDRRRTLLLTCARFFRLLKKSQTAVAVVSEILSNASAGDEEVDDGLGGCLLTEKQQVQLETSRNRAEILGAKTFEEGARLVQMLVAGTGRSDVVRDYSREINLVVKLSEALRADLNAMEEVFTTPPPPSAEPALLTNQPPISTDSLDVTSSSSSSGHQSARESFEEAELALAEQNRQDLEELIGVFVQTLEYQIGTIAHFVQTFSNELASATTDSRSLLKKYQSAYFDLENQWSAMNRCGLDFVAKIIKNHSSVDSSALTSIENALLELNRQFSRVQTLWKDIQINKVQSDIVKLLEVCSRRSSALSSCWSGSSSRRTSANNSANSTKLNSPNNDLPKHSETISFSNHAYYHTEIGCFSKSRQSSGLPSSNNSTSPVDAQLRRIFHHNKPPNLRRCFTTNDVSMLSPVEDSSPRHVIVPLISSSANDAQTQQSNRWLSDPELHCF